MIPKTIHTIPWMAFCNLEGRGLNCKFKVVMGCLGLEFKGMGVFDLEFPQGTDKSVVLENTYFMDLIIRSFRK